MDSRWDVGSNATPCDYFRVSSAQFRAGRQVMRVPVYRCRLGETIALGLECRQVRHAYGPDGKLVSRLSCSLRRCISSCAPGQARAEQRLEESRRRCGDLRLLATDRYRLALATFHREGAALRDRAAAACTKASLICDRSAALRDLQMAA